MGTTTVNHNFGTNVIIGSGYPLASTNNVRSINNQMIDLRATPRIIHAANNASNSTFYSQSGNWAVGSAQQITETARTIAGSIQTFTGGLVSGSNSAVVGNGYYMRVNGPASQYRKYELTTAGSLRWDMAAGNAGETGSDAGSDFYLRAYTDAGSDFHLRAYTDAGAPKSTVMRFSRDGKLAFNGVTPVARPTLAAAATDAATTQHRHWRTPSGTALISLGLAQ